MATKTIDCAKLSAITGLDDATHARLAEQGWIPKASDGAYPLVPTLTGLFRYFTAPAAHRWPICANRKQAAALLGWPAPLFKQLKAAGAPGFRANGSIHLEELLPWIGNKGMAGDIDWSQRLKKMQAQREEIKLAKEKGAVLDRAEVLEAAARAGAALSAQMQRVFLSEFPPLCKGRTEREIRTIAEQKIEAMLAATRKAMGLPA